MPKISELKKGVIYTNVKINHASEQSLNLQSSKNYSHCLSIARRNGVILHTKCFQSYPRWMAEHRDYIGQYTLSTIFLPGTHHSGAYDNTYDPTSPGFSIFNLKKNNAITQVGIN